MDQREKQKDVHQSTPLRSESAAQSVIVRISQRIPSPRMNPVAKIRDLQPAWPPSLRALAAEKLRNDVQGVAAGHCVDEGRKVDVRGIVGTV